MLEKEARKAGINLSKAEKDGHLSTLVNSLAAGSVDELMASIGYARFTTKQNPANQQDEIRRFADSRNLSVSQWVTD